MLFNYMHRHREQAAPQLSISPVLAPREFGLCVNVVYQGHSLGLMKRRQEHRPAADKRGRHGWERTPWRATQRAARAALKMQNAPD